MLPNKSNTSCLIAVRFVFVFVEYDLKNEVSNKNYHCFTVYNDVDSNHCVRDNHYTA